MQQYLLAQKVQIKKSTIPIIRETKKKATAPINIVAGIEPAVKVAKVNTANVDGKLRRQGKTQGYTSDFKKAYVTLTQDSKTIEFFDSLS